ncbi:sugar kinase, partial [Streptomyces sp. A7024]
MVAFRPTRPGPLADVPSFDRGIGGAESNVACAMAAAGRRVRWVSRVGADGFGDHLVAGIAAAGVDVSAVTRDAGRPTGVYFRTAGERSAQGAGGSGGSGVTGTGHEVAYYRAGSAASAMAPGTVDTAALDAARVLHLTGITAALSPGCLALLRALTEPRAGRPLVSFDVNYRAGLWESAADEVLLGLARRADIVFVGDDEAMALWGAADPAAVRALLPEPGVLVVKQGAAGAAAFADRPERPRPQTPDGLELPSLAEQSPLERTAHVPAPTVDVVAAVGAGDAFAAGFLDATLRELPLATRLRHGHLWAAATLTDPGDL